MFNEAPRTNIVEDADEEEDRFAVLPELNIALSRVSELLGDLVRREEGSEDYNQHKGDGEDEQNCSHRHRRREWPCTLHRPPRLLEFIGGGGQGLGPSFCTPPRGGRWC